MKTEKINREKWLHLRLTDGEQQRILKHYSATTHENLSDYARAVLMGKPVVAALRNQSLQEILAELIAMRKELHGVANNFNQLVHKLHTFDHAQQVQTLLLDYEPGHRQLLKNIQLIREYLDQTSIKWLQS